MVERDNPMWFLRHPYLDDARSLAKVLFSFDAERALQNARPVTLMVGTPLNREVLQSYVADIRRIRESIRTTYLNEFLPEFYTHLPFWMSVNEDLNDKNAAFKIYMWSKYQPTLLNGPQNTYRWMQQNGQVIEEASRKALQNIRDEKKNPQGGVIRLYDAMSREEQGALRSFLQTLGVRENEDLRPAIRVLERMLTDDSFARLRLRR